MKNFRYDVLKQKINGLQYINSYVKLKKVGQIFRGVCPFHGEKTPSFTVYPDDYVVNGVRQGYTSFYCFGCGAAGDVINFKQLKEGYNTKEEACYELEKEYGIVTDDSSAKLDYLTEQISCIRHSKGNILSLSEINLIISSICRNYLIWVKNNYLDIYQEEIKYIDKFYIYFDFSIPERTALECESLIDEVNDKIIKRKKAIIGEQ